MNGIPLVMNKTNSTYLAIKRSKMTWHNSSNQIANDDWLNSSNNSNVLCCDYFYLSSNYKGAAFCEIHRRIFSKFIHIKQSKDLYDLINVDYFHLFSTFELLHYINFRVKRMTLIQLRFNEVNKSIILFSIRLD